MLPYDKATLSAFAAANAVLTNPCCEIDISSPTVFTVNSDYIELAGKRFSTKQLAYLLSKLLEEHPECQV